MCIVVNRPYMRYIEVFILMVTSSTSIRFPFSLSASPCVRIRDTGEPPRCPMYIYVCKSFYIFLLFILSSTKPPRRCEKWNENCIKRTHSHTTHTHTHMSWTHIETGNWSGICRDSGQSDLMRTYLSLSTVTTHKPKSEWERWLHCLVCAHCFAHFYRPSTFIQHNHIRLSVYTHSHISICT